MAKRISQSGLFWLWVSVLVLLLDRVSKMLVQQYITPYDTKRLTPFFNLTLAYNNGAAFSFLNGAPGWQGWFFGALAIVISLTLLIWLKKITRQQRWLAIALTLIIGGAIGNLWDRIVDGHVTDFLQFHIGSFYWPTFNFADSGICVGAFMLILDAFITRKHA